MSYLHLKKLWIFILVLFLGSGFAYNQSEPEVFSKEVFEQSSESVVMPKGDQSVLKTIELSRNLLDDDSMYLYYEEGIDSNLENYIYKALLDKSQEIDISSFKIPLSDVGTTWRSVFRYHPDLFHVDYSMVSYGHNYEYVTKVYPTYINSEEVDIKAKSFNEEINKIKNLIRPWMSDLEIALIVNDYLTVHVEYDKKNYDNNSIPDESYTAYGALVLGTAVCQGYTEAYLHLLRNVFGVPTEYVLSSSMNHTWNMVKIDGDYYHVDVTWNDPTPDYFGNAGHGYFLLSDEQISRQNHYDWTSPVNATNKRFDGEFWRYVETPFVRIIDMYFYISRDQNIMKWTPDDNSHVVAFEISLDSIHEFQWSNAIITKARGKIYFSALDSIYSLNSDGTGLFKEYTISPDEDKKIMRFMFKDELFKYALLSSRYSNEEEIIQIAPIELAPAVTSVTLDVSDFRLDIGKQKIIKAEVTPADAMNKSIKWFTSDPGVATAEEGVVTGISDGMAMITAITLDGDKAAEVKAVVGNYVGIVPDEIINIAGENRYTTAVEISKALYTKSDTAILVPGNNYPDALAAGPLAKMLKAPILLSQKERVSSSTLTELKRLGVTKIVLLGGKAVISENVEEILKDNEITNTSITSVIRISGNNRYETAVETARMLSGGNKMTKVILASGDSFADALSVGSYASRNGIPILLTRKTGLSGITNTALNEMGVEEVIIIGGDAAVSQVVEDEVAKYYKVTRVSGENRYSTAVAISERYFISPKEAIIASGIDFADALSAAPLAAEKNIPILLVSSKNFSTAVKDYLNQEFNTLYIVGGASAIGEDVRIELLKTIK